MIVTEVRPVTKDVQVSVTTCDVCGAAEVREKTIRGSVPKGWIAVIQLFGPLGEPEEYPWLCSWLCVWKYAYTQYAKQGEIQK